MPNEIFDTPPLRMIDLNATDVFAGICLAFALNFILAKISAWANKSTSINSNSNLPMCMVLLGSIVSLIMAVIGNSLARAFGAIGALSLIRFRTAVKDPLDLVQLFMTISIGMTTGSGHFIIACGATLIFGILLSIINYLPLKKKKTLTLLIKLNHSLDKDIQDKLFSLIKSSVYEYNILSQEQVDNSKTCETIFEVICNDIYTVNALFPKFAEIDDTSKAIIINN